MEKSVSAFMAEAIRLSEYGMLQGDGGPFGAVVVKGDTIIGRGWNRVLSTNDPTAHAEVTAIRDACSAINHYWLEGCRLYVNCEPCPMCLAAIHWARIEHIIFAASRRDAEQIGFIDSKLYQEICSPFEQRAIRIDRENHEAAVEIMLQWPALATRQNY